MSNYPSNSHISREKAAKESKPKKQIKRVTTSTAVPKKKSLGRRFLDTFGGESAESVGQYVLRDVLVPAIKDLVSDMVTSGIERALFGEARPRVRRGGFVPQGYSPAGYTPYHRAAAPAPNRPPAAGPAPRSAGNTYQPFLLPTRVETQAVLDEMYSVLSQYQVISVSDYYEILGASQQATFTDQNWGWYDLQGSGIGHDHNGYWLELPRPVELEPR